MAKRIITRLVIYSVWKWIMNINATFNMLPMI